MEGGGFTAIRVMPQFSDVQVASYRLLFLLNLKPKDI